MVTDGQVRRLHRELDSGTTLAAAARRTGMVAKTARHYRDDRKLPSTRLADRRQLPRTYRTRPDLFAEVWPAVEARLKAEPRLLAKTLFDWLRHEHPGQFFDSQGRTFERRVQQWRALHGPGKAIMFRQIHEAGDLAASDFTHMNSLNITIAGQPFDHLVYHFVLTYSNWESVTVCASESFEALSDGLQNALWELGGVPRRHRSDSLTAAVNNHSEKREFQTRYRDLLTHYGLTGQRDADQQLAVLTMDGDLQGPMTTAAAIDRLVHHSVIVELNVPSYRLETAKGSKTALNDAASTTKK